MTVKAPAGAETNAPPRALMPANLTHPEIKSRLISNFGEKSLEEQDFAHLVLRGVSFHKEVEVALPGCQCPAFPSRDPCHSDANGNCVAPSARGTNIGPITASGRLMFQFLGARDRISSLARALRTPQCLYPPTQSAETPDRSHILVIFMFGSVLSGMGADIAMESIPPTPIPQA